MKFTPEWTHCWGWCLLRAVGDQRHHAGSGQGGRFPPGGVDSQPGGLWLLSARPSWGESFWRAGVDLERSELQDEPFRSRFQYDFKCKLDWTKHHPDLKSRHDRPDHWDTDVEVHSFRRWGDHHKVHHRFQPFASQKTYVATKANEGTGETVVWKSFDPRVDQLGKPIPPTSPTSLYLYDPIRNPFVFLMGWNY